MTCVRRIAADIILDAFVALALTGGIVQLFDFARDILAVVPVEQRATNPTEDSAMRPKTCHSWGRVAGRGYANGSAVH